MVERQNALARTTLSNGLRVITETIPHVRSVAAGIWLGVGSRLEPDHLAGISHFIEHMAFKGTATRTARELAAAIDRIGGQLNAYTTREYTCFHARVLEHRLADALELLADMLLRPRFDPSDIEVERGVVLEELRLYEDTPDELVHDLASACLWPHDPLGRPVLGTPAALEAFDRDAVLDFYRRAYTPGNAVLVAAGCVEHDEVVRLAEALFGPWRPGPGLPAPARAPQPAAGRCVRVKDTEQVHLCVVSQGCALDDPDLYGTLALVNILGGGSSSRLFQEVREERGLAYSVYAFQGSYRDTGLVGVYAGTAVETAPQVLELILAECRRLCREPVSRDELERTREQLKAELVLGLESTSSRMGRIGRSELLLGRVPPIDELLARLDQVDAGQIQRLACRMLDPGQLAIAAVAPVEQPFGDGLGPLPPGA